MRQAKMQWTVFGSFVQPELIMPDNGSIFTRKEFKAFLQRNGIQKTRTAPYHSASNAQSERAFQAVKNTLTKMMNEKGTPNEKKVYNYLQANLLTPSSSKSCTSTKLLFGWRLRIDIGVAKVNLQITWGIVETIWSIKKTIEKWGSYKFDNKYLFVILVLVQDGSQGSGVIIFIYFSSLVICLQDKDLQKACRLMIKP